MRLRNSGPLLTGCPATAVIKADLKATLMRAGYTAQIREVLSPPWSSDWITPTGRAQLREYGIAPPLGVHEQVLSCPRCASRRVELLSEFGSTPCKSLHRCLDCLEPFDHFKCI